MAKHSSLAMTAAALLASAGMPAFAQQTAGDPDAGAEHYYKYCKTCHSGMIAPALNGIAGRRIASYPGFGGYSAKLKTRASDSWTDANLDAFLKSPAAMAPECVTPDMGDAEARADMIAFLKSLPPTG